MNSKVVITPEFDKLMMQLALEQANQAWAIDEVPVGAVIVQDGQVIAQGHNRVIIDNDPSAHAEIVAVRHAGQLLNNYRLPNTTVYVTLEPCPMCLSALFHSRVARLVYGAADPKTGACGGKHDLTQLSINHHTVVQGGVLEQTCSEMLKRFFKARRDVIKLAKMNV